MSPPLFLFRFFIWRSSENKSDVCHVLCEVLIMLDVTHSQVDVETEFGVVVLCACKLANSQHASFTLYLFSVLSHIFMLFNHLREFLCTLYAIYCVVILHHLPTVFILHFYDFSVACCQPFR